MERLLVLPNANPFSDHMALCITQFAAHQYGFDIDRRQNGGFIRWQRRVMHGHAQHAGDFLSTRLKQAGLAPVVGVRAELHAATSSVLAPITAEHPGKH